ncbi:hypothetical protein NPIL_648251, partial [Nephila pilipes]
MDCFLPYWAEGTLKTIPIPPSEDENAQCERSNRGGHDCFLSNERDPVMISEDTSVEGLKQFNLSSNT